MEIIQNAGYLSNLSLAKNFMKSDVGKPLSKLMKYSNCLRKLNLEFNELQM